jgi:hypothetical protein
MNPRIKAVKALDNFLLEIEFKNNERKLFDVKPYINIGVFIELQNPEYFKLVKVNGPSIACPNEQDFCPDTLYLDSYTN